MAGDSPVYRGEMEIRPYAPSDADAVRALAPRLAEGVAQWRREDAVRSAVTDWVEGSMAAADTPGRALLVAVEYRSVLGFVSVGTRDHWAGDVDAYIGELVVSTSADRQGIGSALLAAAERWAGEYGLSRIQLETGAANDPALAFYAARGFEVEEVRLSKPVEGSPTAARWVTRPG